MYITKRTTQIEFDHDDISTLKLIKVNLETIKKALEGKFNDHCEEEISAFLEALVFEV